MNNVQKPVTKIALFPVNAAIWRHAKKDGGSFYSVTFDRSYRNEAGEWQSSNRFNENELLLLAKAADLVHSKLIELKAQDQQQADPDQPET